MRRRTVLSTGAALATAGLAGCSVTDMESDDDVFTVGTYTSFVDAPSDSPGEWIKDEFESRHDVEFEWHTPDQELTYYVERHNDGSEVEPELYLGVRPQNLVQADEQLEGELFTSTDESVLSNADDIDDEFYFDPEDRAIPTFHSRSGIVYDGRNMPEPETFDDLLSSEYEGNLAVSNPNSSTTGLLFFLWTVDYFGEDGYLEYWNDLIDNDARVLDEWAEVYTQFEEEEVPAVVSYTDDRVYASRDGNDLDKHQVATLHDQGYANMAGMARFADGTDDDLAHEFMDFILEPEVQSVIAERNVTGPVNEETELPEEIEEYMVEPEEVIFFDYDELEGNLSTWLDDWDREVAGGF